MKDLIGIEIIEETRMGKEILVFHPDINVHKTNNEYTKRIYSILADEYEVRSFEWYIKHPMSKVYAMYLNWMENTIGRDTVVIQKIQYALKMATLRWAHARGAKIFYVVHNKTPHSLARKSEIYQKATKSFIMRALQMADTIVELCEHTEAYISSEFGMLDIHRKMALIPVGKYTKYDCDLQQYREKYGIKPKELVFAFVGKMDKYKNIDIILEAFYMSGVDAKILLVGKINPEYEGAIRKLILDDKVITNFSFVTDQDMSGLMQMSDAILLPYENTSINSGIMINAFSNGTTVIGTDIEMLQDYDDELVYSYSYTDRYEHVNALSKAMKRAARDGKEHLEQNGRKLEEIMNLYNDWSIVRKALLDVCR